MSIDALLTRLAEALEANTEVNSRVAELLASGAKPSASKPASTSTKAADKPADKPASKPASSKTTKQKGATTVEDVTERVTTYLKTGSKAEREERKGHVKAILDHYEAERFTAIDPENFDEALGFLDAYENGDDPFAGDGADEGDEDDGAMV